MSKFLSTIREVRLRLFKVTEILKTVSGTHLKNLGVKMEEKKVDEVNGEPPAKKLCPDVVNENIAKPIKIKKRNVALLMAYNGANYYGMQVNSGYNTVESELISALEKAKFVPADTSKNLHLVHFQRAARTDKGVSAAKQVVSFKIAENFDIEKINSYLPDDIRVLGIKRVTKGFNCKNQCYGRTYSYTLPTYALAPEFHTEVPVDYRISQETINNVNEILKSFEGTHAFHNFTARKDGRDPSASRYIMSFKACEPFIDKEEFITLQVKGQSFMLHQIRKMVGYTIALLKGFVPEDIKTRIWNTNEKLSVPMAPGLGLVLEDVHYDRYNMKFGGDGLHHSLTWDEASSEIENFRKNVIFSKIVDTEITDRVMFNWLEFLPTHKYEFKESEKTPSEETDQAKEEPPCESRLQMPPVIKVENCG